MSSSQESPHIGPPKRPRLMNTSHLVSKRYPPGSHRVQDRHLKSGSGTADEPSSRTAQQGWVFITCSPYGASCRWEGQPSRIAWRPRTTCSFLSRGKYDVFTILPGCNHAWCPSRSRIRRDWVSLWQIQSCNHFQDLSPGATQASATTQAFPRVCEQGRLALARI